MDCAEKERLIAALGKALVAKIPQVYDHIPANNLMLLCRFSLTFYGPGGSAKLAA